VSIADNTKLQLKEASYAIIGVAKYDVDRQPQITPHLRQIMATIKRMTGGKTTQSPWYFLKCSDAPEAQKVLEEYYSEKLSKNQRSTLPIEAFCLAAKVSPLRILEIIGGTAVRLSAQESMMISALNHPRVVEKTVEMALTDEGTYDRNVLHRATGFLPIPRTAQTTINVAQNATVTAAHVSAAPPPERTIRTLSNRFNEARRELAEPPLDIVPQLPEGVGNYDADLAEVEE
jgi:hypothetical protein